MSRGSAALFEFQDTEKKLQEHDTACVASNELFIIIVIFYS